LRDMERRHSTPRLDATERPSACYRATVFRATVFETEASRPCYRLRDGSFELLCGGAGRRPDGRGAEVGGGDAVAARHGHSSAPLGAAATRRTVSWRAHPRQTPLILALCLLPATCALAPPVRQESAMGVNEHGAYDFHARARRMPPPIPMPPRSFFEVASPSLFNRVLPVTPSDRAGVCRIAGPRDSRSLLKNRSLSKHTRVCLKHSFSPHATVNYTRAHAYHSLSLSLSLALSRARALSLSAPSGVVGDAVVFREGGAAAAPRARDTAP